MSLTFAEMFSGIGGFRLGLERSGWRCVWANDWDKYANRVYKKKFGCGELVEGDIREVKANSVPDHTLLTAGFPCQAFSVAGKRKGLSEARGTLFAHIVRVARAKRPPLLLLENVKGILSSDDGRTFAVILRALAELGYLLEWQVLNSKHYGVPQNRERVFVVGHLGNGGGRKIFPIREGNGEAVQNGTNDEGQETAWSLRGRDYKDGTNFGYWRNSKDKWVQEKRQESLALKGQSDLCRQPLILADSTRTYASKGRNLESPKTETNALSSVQKDNLLIYNHPRNKDRKFLYDPRESLSNLRTVQRLPSKILEDSKKMPLLSPYTQIRRLTPTECERLQGFPDGWTEGVSDTQRYKCLGNAVTVNVIEFLGKKLSKLVVERKTPCQQ